MRKLLFLFICVALAAPLPAVAQAGGPITANTANACGSASYPEDQIKPVLQTRLGMLCVNAFVAPLQTTQVMRTQQTTDTGIAVSGHILVISFEATTSNCTTTCFAEIFDSATVPIAGTYTGTTAPYFCFPIPTDSAANPFKGISMANVPVVSETVNGMAVVVNSGADCFHLTKVASYISAQYVVP